MNFPGLGFGLVAATLALLLLPSAAPANDEPAELIPQLAPLAPFVGKTWRGELVMAPGQPPATDIARWERALNGTAVRILHSVNDGAYGGETLVFWDAQAQAISYYYFTTAGFHTKGTMRPVENGFEGTEVVTGNADGVTEVRFGSVFLPDGTMRATSQYLKDGAWVPGHEAVYREDPAAAVVFR